MYHAARQQCLAGSAKTIGAADGLAAQPSTTAQIAAA